MKTDPMTTKTFPKAMILADVGRYITHRPCLGETSPSTHQRNGRVQQ